VYENVVKKVNCKYLVSFFLDFFRVFSTKTEEGWEECSKEKKNENEGKLRFEPYILFHSRRNVFFVFFVFVKIS